MLWKVTPRALFASSGSSGNLLKFVLRASRQHEFATSGNQGIPGAAAAGREAGDEGEAARRAGAGREETAPGAAGCSAAGATAAQPTCAAARAAASARQSRHSAVQRRY